MYMYAGHGEVIETEAIIGIFDLDITSQSYLTRDFLAAAEKNGQIVNASEDIPKSYIICDKNKKTKIYLTQPATATLIKRATAGLV